MNRFLYIIITIAIIFLPCWIVALVFIDHYNLLMNSPWIYVDSIQSSESSVVSQEIITVDEPNGDIAFSTLNATITAFNTVEEQTDDRPCESASGDWICGRTDVVACPPHIPFHTWVEIPIGIDQVFGATIIKRFECLDRTASKYSDRFDISYDKDIQGALIFGRQTLEVKIYK